MKFSLRTLVTAIVGATAFNYGSVSVIATNCRADDVSGSVTIALPCLVIGALLLATVAIEVATQYRALRKRPVAS
jgi:hypothetical protein